MVEADGNLISKVVQRAEIFLGDYYKNKNQGLEKRSLLATVGEDEKLNVCQKLDVFYVLYKTGDYRKNIV